jgi:hypothetical protein
LRAFAISRLNRLRDVLADPKAIREARALLAEWVGKFTLEGVSEGGKISFKANGEIDLFGEVAFTQLKGEHRDRYGPFVSGLLRATVFRHFLGFLALRGPR